MPQDLKPRAKLDSKGRILIPQWIRKRTGIKEGSILEIDIYGEQADKILLTILSK